MTKPAAPPRPRRQPPRPPRRAKATLIYDSLEKAPAANKAKSPPPPPQRKPSIAPPPPKRQAKAQHKRNNSSAPPPPRRRRAAAQKPARPAPAKQAQPVPAKQAPAKPVAAKQAQPAPAKPVAKQAPAKPAAQPFDARATVKDAPLSKAAGAHSGPAAKPSTPPPVAQVSKTRDVSRTLASELVALAASKAAAAPIAAIAATAPAAATAAPVVTSAPAAARQARPIETGHTTARTRAKRSRELKPGDVIADRYQVSAIISRARGLLLDASHTGFDQRVVVRVLTRTMVDEKAVEQFNREARVLSRLESEHVARIVDFGRMPDGALYLAREYVRGKSLSNLAAAHGGLPVEQAVLHLLQIAEAVQEAHTEGVVLRDMQPGHVFLADKRNGAPVAKLTDFGTCKVVKDPSAGGELSCTRLLGLSSSASPELVRQSKTISERADVWSLGCLLYELLTGQPAFSGEGVQLALSITRDEPTPVTTLRPELPAHLDQVLAWALAKDPSKRFRDVYAFAHELRRFACRRGRLLIEEIGRLATGQPVAPIEQETEDDSSMAMVCNIQPEQPTLPDTTTLVPAAALMQQRPSQIPAARQSAPQAAEPTAAQRHATMYPAAAQAAQRPSTPPRQQPSVHPSAPPPAGESAMQMRIPPHASVPAAALRPSQRPVPLTAAAQQQLEPWMIAEPKPRRGRLAWLAALPAAALVALAVSFATAPAAANADSGGLHAAATAASAIDTSAYAAPAPEVPAAQEDADSSEGEADDADADAKDAEQKVAQPRQARPTGASRYSYQAPRRSGGQFLRALNKQKQQSRPKARSGARGTLVAMAVGSSCNFSVDGASRGTSSSIRVSVPAGRHTVTCRSSNGTRRSRSLQIAPGKASVTVFKF